MTHEYADKLAQNLEDLDASEDSQTLWSTFKSHVLETASECIPKSRRRKQEGASEETVEINEKCRKARLDGKAGLQKKLRRRAKRAMRADLESKIQGLCKVVEENLATGN